MTVPLQWPCGQMHRWNMVVTKAGYVTFCRGFSSSWWKAIIHCCVVLCFGGGFFWYGFGFSFKQEVKKYSHWKYLRSKTFWKKLSTTRKGFFEHFRSSQLPQATNSSVQSKSHFFYNTVQQVFAIAMLRTKKAQKISIYFFGIVAKARKTKHP